MRSFEKTLELLRESKADFVVLEEMTESTARMLLADPFVRSTYFLTDTGKCSPLASR